MACADVPSVISAGDWASLFDAVVMQLRLTVAVRTGDGADAPVHDADRVRDRVLECVAALEKLRAARASGEARRVPLLLAATRP